MRLELFSTKKLKNNSLTILARRNFLVYLLRLQNNYQLILILSEGQKVIKRAEVGLVGKSFIWKLVISYLMPENTQNIHSKVVPDSSETDLDIKKERRVDKT